MIGALTWKLRRAYARLPIGAACRCCLCGARVRRFLPYRGGWRAAPAAMRALRVIGSDLDHFACPRCGCHDRERHLWLYMNKYGLLERMRGAVLLHFAPELALTTVLAHAGLSRHVMADLNPSRPEIVQMDMLSTGLANSSFDFVMANHVMEHVDDDMTALRELRRVLKPGGLAILQTPYSDVLERTFADPGIRTPEQRLELYGQEDHVRLYGRDIFDRFASAGFASRAARHADALPDVEAPKFGVNPSEPFFLFEAIENRSFK